MKKTIYVVAILAIATAVLAQTPQKSGPKVFISVDMEGIWGVVHGNQTSASSPEYASARRWMAEDTNAVIAGLFDAGAAEIVVNDAHGNMRNIVADAIDRRAALVSGSPKALSMLQGIDASFDACVMVGYHARAGSTPAILDHTISGGTIRAIRINGQELPELGIYAAMAGYFKVPVIMLTGDTTTCEQAKSILGNDVVTVAVKEAFGRQAALIYPADKVRARLREGAAEALRNKAKAPLFRIDPPLKFEVEFGNSAQSEPAMMLPQVKRVNARAVTFTSNDYIEGFKLMRAIIALSGTIS